MRGNDRDGDGRYLMDRDGFIPEVMRFLDQHLRGIAPAVTDPPLAVHGSDGRWRTEQAWPPADARAETTALRAGAYLDEGGNHGTCQERDETTGECADEAIGKGLWSISQPLARTTQLAGTPRITVDVGAPADANLVAAVYDIDPDGDATLVSRGAYLLRGSGQVGFELYGNDWRFEPGHRIGVLLSSAHDEWWEHRASGGEVEVRGAAIDLLFLRRLRTANLAGGPAAKLESYRAEAPFEVDAATIADAETPFTLRR